MTEQRTATGEADDQPIPAVVVTFRLQRRDIEPAVRHVLRARLAFVLAVVYVIGVVPTAVGEADVGQAVAHAVAVGLFVLALFWVGSRLGLRGAARVRWRQDPLLRQEITQTFSDEGIQIRTASTQTRLDWSLLTDVVEVKHLFLIKERRRVVSIVPRRAFVSPEDEKRFCELAARHIGVVSEPRRHIQATAEHEGSATIHDRRPDVVVTFRLEPREIARAYRQLLLGSRKWLICFAAIWAGAMVGAVAHGDVVWIISIAIWPVLTVVIANRQYREWLRSPQLRAEQTTTYSDEGIHIQTASADAQISWSACTRLAETTEVFLIRHTYNAVHLVPRRAFASPEDEDRFRQLATRHLAAGVSLGESGDAFGGHDER